MDDDTEIRNVIATWMLATQTGDVETVLGLMTDDVVFLVAGQAPFGKREFAAMSQAQAGSGMQFDGRSEVQEVRVSGDWAFAWTKLEVMATTADAPPIRRAGHTLSVFNKQDGRWRLARDANLLTTVAAS